MNLDSIGDWTRTHYTSAVTPEIDGQEVTLFGWVQEIRDLGGIRFIILQDREGTIQITIPKKRIAPEVLAKSDLLQKRFSLAVKGVVKKTNMTPRGIEVVPSGIKVLSTATEQLPIDITGKTPANIEARLDARALDLTQEKNLAAFKIQHTALAAIRSFLYEKGFLEVHTPRIIGSATEGGAELFSVKYFEQKAYLAQSPQLYKEELTLSFEKVFEVGPFFRAEESHTRRHLSEFTSVDIEEAFANAQDVMALLEQVIHHTCVTVRDILPAAWRRQIISILVWSTARLIIMSSPRPTAMASVRTPAKPVPRLGHGRHKTSVRWEFPAARRSATEYLL